MKGALKSLSLISFLQRNWGIDVKKKMLKIFKRINGTWAQWDSWPVCLPAASSCGIVGVLRGPCGPLFLSLLFSSRLPTGSWVFISWLKRTANIFCMSAGVLEASGVVCSEDWTTGTGCTSFKDSSGAMGSESCCWELASVRALMDWFRASSCCCISGLEWILSSCAIWGMLRSVWLCRRFNNTANSLWFNCCVMSPRPVEIQGTQYKRMRQGKDLAICLVFGHT